MAFCLPGAVISNRASSIVVITHGVIRMTAADGNGRNLIVLFTDNLGPAPIRNDCTVIID